ncbi:hypothetical protein DPMN_000007 [Dreissena polymorpha]|uniref:Uncharacterized protein n=1 Tax=Dreissena polymorpha TaxID=45954 RepID=A0A9D4MEK9_DREPO|nr:hypothetical protein DPMN_000007 [Dreissena polymorpha]
MWKLNAPENIELEFPVPEDISENKTPPQKQGHQQEEHKEGRLPERFIIPKKNKQSKNNVTSRTPLDIDKRIVTQSYEPKNNVFDKILNKMDNPSTRSVPVMRVARYLRAVRTNYRIYRQFFSTPKPML